MSYRFDTVQYAHTFEQWRPSNNHLGDKVVSFDRKLNRLLR
jgi:hypothetical protein